MWQRLQGTNRNVCILCTHDVSSDHVHAGSRHEKTSNAPAQKTVPAKQPQPASSKSKKPERMMLAQHIEGSTGTTRMGRTSATQRDTLHHSTQMSQSNNLWSVHGSRTKPNGAHSGNSVVMRATRLQNEVNKPSTLKFQK